MPSSSLESLIMFTDRGKAYTIRVADITSTTGYGEPVQTRFDFADGEHVVGAICTDPRCLPAHNGTDGEPPAEKDDGVRAENDEQPAVTGDETAPSDVPTPIDEACDPTAAEGVPEQKVDREIPPGPYAVAISRGGKSLRFALNTFREASTRNGRIFMRLDRKMPIDGVISVVMSDGTEIVSLASKQAHCLLFPVDQIKVLSGPGKGVMAIKLKRDDYVLGFYLTKHRMDGLEVETNRGRIEIIRPNKYRVTSRGGRGREIIRVGYLVRTKVEPLEIELPTDEDREVLELTPPEEEDLAQITAEAEADKEEPVPAEDIQKPFKHDLQGDLFGEDD